MPARLEEEYLIDNINDRLTLLHIFLFEIPIQFQSQHSIYKPY